MEKVALRAQNVSETARERAPRHERGETERLHASPGEYIHPWLQNSHKGGSPTVGWGVPTSLPQRHLVRLNYSDGQGAPAGLS